MSDMTLSVLACKQRLSCILEKGLVKKITKANRGRPPPPPPPLNPPLDIIGSVNEF